MIAAQPTPDETRRMEALRSYGVLDTLPEKALDDLAALAAQICGAPIAMVSLIDADRQWFKAKVGMEMAETPRDIAFCGHAVHQRDLFIVPDATQDERFSDNPLVTGEPRICFYAGAPLVSPEELALGALCVIDHVPRTLTQGQEQALRVLARQVMTHLELRRYTRELVDSEERLRMVTENARVGLVMVDRDRRYIYANRAYAEMLDLPSPAIVGQRVPDVLPGVYEEQIRPRLDRAFAGERVACELRKPAEAGDCHYAVRYEPMKVNGEVTVVVEVVTDITESKQAEEVLHGVASRESGSQRRRVFRDLAIIFMLSAIVYTIGYVYDVFDPIFNYCAYQNHQLNSDLDEVVATMAFFGLAMLVFSYRRLMESREEVLTQTQISKALNILRAEMEAQVRQRTAELVHTNEELHNEIAERQRVEAIIRQFPAIIETSDDAIISKTLDGIIKTWNPAAERMFGYTAKEIVGEPITSLFPPDRLEEESEIIGRISRGERVQHFETVRVRKDGLLLNVSATISPIKDDEGKIIGVSKIVRDISGRKRTERALIESESKFRSLFDEAYDAIFILHNGLFVDSNAKGLELFGLTRDQLIGQSPALFSPPNQPDGSESAEKTGEIIRNALAGEPQFFEWIHHRPDGAAVYSEVHVSRFEQHGEPYLQAIARDITERRLAEETRRAAEARYRRLFEYAPDGILIANPENRYIDANASMCRMLGYTRDELIGLNASDIIAESQIPRIAAAFSEIQAALDHHQEWQFRRKDDSIFSVDAIATLMPDGNVMAMIRDITERNRAQEQIAEQAALLDKARDAILVRDLEGKVLYWNNGAERIYGWTRQEAIGRNVRDLFYADPKKFEEVNGLTVSQGEWNGELKHRTMNRGEITVEARWTLIRDNEGHRRSVLAINTDITERKKIEAQFLRAQRMESIGTLAGGIAHDLNNILSPIMMAVEILKTTSADPQATRILETLEVSAQRGSDIVRQVLSFARGIEGARVEVQPKHLLKDLGSIIKDTFPKDIRLQFSIPNETWTILGDPTQVHQILLNLCVNARDAMPNGGSLIVSVENCVLDEHYAAMNIQAKAGRYVMTSVTDTGTGMPPALLDKIFEPFFTTKELNKGTGLGLSTVMAIIKSHEGFVNVYSEPGKGTTFKVYLPATEISSGGRTQQAEAVSLPRGEGETILLVDDEASILTITSQTLQAFGYRVLEATNGAEAVAVYAEHKNEIAVVLTDMMMPVMDGPATIHALTRMTPGIKIIGASGLNENSGVARASGAGLKHFLTKPYTARTLLKVVRAILDEV